MKSAALFSFAFAPKEREILSTFFHSKSPYIKYEREQNALLREERNDDDDDDDNTFEEDDDDEAKRDVYQELKIANNESTFFTTGKVDLFIRKVVTIIIIIIVREAFFPTFRKQKERRRA